MNARRSILIVAALVLALLATGGVAAAPALACSPEPVTLTTFAAGDWGSFAEGMAADSHGNLYVSLTTWGYFDETTADSNIGELWKVSPAGVATPVAAMDLSPYGMLGGVAVDCLDRVYVTVWDMGTGMTLNGVCRLAHGTLEQVVALPQGSWPNGLAIHDGSIWISDSALGAVWRTRASSRLSTPETPWVQSDLLAPGDPAADETALGIGANGLAFRGDRLYVAVSDYGRIVSVPVRHDCSPGRPAVACERPRLKTADGIAFDVAGGLWIATNAGTTGDSPSGALYRLAPGGRLTTVTDDPGWLDYPTTPVFGTTPGTRRTLFVENGAYDSWDDGVPPDVQALHVGVPGLPLR